jgi:REP element-mobilizing transposase RayT
VVATSICVPRKSRNDAAGGFHHVFPRGNSRQVIFYDAADRQVFLVILKGVVDAYRWRLLAYCLMGNHVHLVIETCDGNLGRGMQRLLGTYARFFNRRHDRMGHLFGTTFKSEPIADDDQLATAIAYVAANPVRAGLCKVEGEWQWSSHGGAACVHRQALIGLPED